MTSSAGVAPFAGKDDRVSAESVEHRGRGIRNMRFTKAAMAICAVCAMMLAMTGIRRMRKKSMQKRQGMFRSRNR
jgi:hypothetical protein